MREGSRGEGGREEVMREKRGRGGLIWRGRRVVLMGGGGSGGGREDRDGFVVSGGEDGGERLVQSSGAHRVDVGLNVREGGDNDGIRVGKEGLSEGRHRGRCRRGGSAAEELYR